uniref:AIG1-type G domain-containing protein n=1 Tax=Cyprinus carpio TaxID=7962 RepID=A0A8C1XT56_CYPCA
METEPLLQSGEQEIMFLILEMHRLLLAGVQFLFDLRIVLLGNRAAGKTSLANLITGHAEPHLKRTAQCVKMHGDFAGRQVTVVDTPGWWKNYLVKETPEFQKQEILLSVAHCPPGPHAVLLIIRVDALFKEKHRRSVQEHLELLSERVWNHTIVVFTYRDQLQEQTLGNEGKALQWLVEKCGNRYHVLNNENWNDDSQVKDLLEKIEKMVAQNRGHYYEIDLKTLKEVNYTCLLHKQVERIFPPHLRKIYIHLLVHPTHA